MNAKDKQNFVLQKIFSKNVIAVYKIREVMLNKPVMWACGY